jgi:benzoyl-CoA reductase subunit C
VSALERVRDIRKARLRAARAAHEAGQRTVGLLGPTVPAEFILAAGCFPVMLAAEDPHPTPDADRLIEKSEPWPLRALAQRALEGSLEFLDLMVIPRAEEWLFYNLKEAVRIGEGARVPALHLHDLIQSHMDEVAAFNQVQTDLLLGQLRRLSPPSDDWAGNLRAAVSITNKRRTLLAALNTLRDEGRLSGVDAMSTIGAVNFVHPEEGCALLERVTGEARKAEPIRRPRLLVLPGEPLYHTRLHEALEASGAIVVAEDTWWGSRAANEPIALDGDLVAAVHASYVRDTQSEDVQPPQARQKWVRARAARGDLDGAVFYLPPGDRKLGWEYPELKAALEALGVKTLRVRDDVMRDGGEKAVRQCAEVFVASLTGGAR